MTIRILTVAAALALPVLAQDPRPASAPAVQAVSAETENMFYRAFYLERGEKRGAEALPLYEKFLAAAPNHRFAKKAAESCIAILNQDGKIEEADKVREKYAAILRRPAAAEGAAEAPAAPERPGRGQRGEGAPGRGQMTPEARAERVAELKKQLEEAKAAGNDEQVARLERMIQMMESGRGGAGGQGGRGGRGMGIFGDTKLADMTDEQLGQFKSGLDQMSGFIDRMRDNGQAERADQLEKSISQIKKHLEEGKKDEAQKIVDEMRAQMRNRRGDR